jgi:T5orf172 domain
VARKFAKNQTINCAVEGCVNPVPRWQDCWECGKPHCSEHLKSHERCVRFRICPNPQCWEDHVPWCETHEPHRGPLPVGKKLGTGEECVYVYYNKTQFENSRLQKQDKWLCKIGRTKGDPTVRIVLQGALTAHSEVPTIPLTLHTEDSKNLERWIHATLSYAGRHQKGVPGAEWFMTNPAEVEHLYHSLEDLRTSLEIASQS